MSRLSLLSRGVAVSALIMMGSVPAIAGKADRARSAIDQAKAKVEAADKVGASMNTPALTARADAALATAQEDLKSGHKEDAFDAATQASELADTALGQAQKAHAEQLHAAQDNAAQTGAAAQAAVDSANQRADAATQAANDASQRADAASQAAAAASEQAAAAQAAPAPTTTTVTSHTTTHRARVVHVPAGSTTTTKVTTAPAQTPAQ